MDILIQIKDMDFISCSIDILSNKNKSEKESGKRVISLSTLFLALLLLPLLDLNQRPSD
jgi:hypothetical protein